MSDLIRICLDLKAVFSKDPSAPGVTVSNLPNGRWYVSALRYTQPMGKGKVVLAKAQGLDLQSALSTLVDEMHLTPQWKANTQRESAGGTDE